MCDDINRCPTLVPAIPVHVSALLSAPLLNTNTTFVLTLLGARYFFVPTSICPQVLATTVARPATAPTEDALLAAIPPAVAALHAATVRAGAALTGAARAGIALAGTAFASTAQPVAGTASASTVRSAAAAPGRPGAAVPGRLAVAASAQVGVAGLSSD